MESIIVPIYERWNIRTCHSIRIPSDFLELTRLLKCPFTFTITIAHISRLLWLDKRNVKRNSMTSLVITSVSVLAAAVCHKTLKRREIIVADGLSSCRLKVPDTWRNKTERTFNKSRGRLVRRTLTLDTAGSAPSLRSPRWRHCSIPR
jgi:hypothetical protein